MGNKKIIVGTHHKTGTVLMLKIFKGIERRLGLTLFNCSVSHIGTSHANAMQAGSLEWDVLFDYNSEFKGLVVDDRMRGVHVVRDPRMVVVSSAFYHMRSSEKWLHLPRPEFGGRTYQQEILSLTSDRDRFLFEMENASRNVIKAMDAWARKSPQWCMDVKLEDLMLDEGLDWYFKIFRHLGFSGKELIVCLDVAFGQSVFNPAMRPASHIRSVRPESWHDYYDDELIGVFEAKFGDIAQRLGYP